MTARFEIKIPIDGISVGDRVSTCFRESYDYDTSVREGITPIMVAYDKVDGSMTTWQWINDGTHDGIWKQVSAFDGEGES